MGKEHKGQYMGSVKVGPKGQIVIPKEVRDMFNIESGDSLVLLGDKERGIALNTFDFYKKIADEIFKNQKNVDEGTINFASVISNLKEEEDD